MMALWGSLGTFSIWTTMACDANGRAREALESSARSPRGERLPIESPDGMVRAEAATQ